MTPKPVVFLFERLTADLTKEKPVPSFNHLTHFRAKLPARLSRVQLCLDAGKKRALLSAGSRPARERLTALWLVDPKVASPVVYLPFTRDALPFPTPADLAFGQLRAFFPLRVPSWESNLQWIIHVCFFFILQILALEPSRPTGLIPSSQPGVEAHPTRPPKSSRESPTWAQLLTSG